MHVEVQDQHLVCSLIACHPPFVSEIKISHSSWGCSLVKLGWPHNKFQRSSCLWSPNTGVTETLSAPLSFSLVPGELNLGPYSYLQGRHFTHRDISPAWLYSSRVRHGRLWHREQGFLTSALLLWWVGRLIVRRCPVHGKLFSSGCSFYPSDARSTGFPQPIQSHVPKTEAGW